MVGLLAGAMALGCQRAPQVVPGGSRTVVHFGAVKLEPDADMAIVLNQLDCKPGDYALQQAAGPVRGAVHDLQRGGPAGGLRQHRRRWPRARRRSSIWCVTSTRRIEWDARYLPLPVYRRLLFERELSQRLLLANSFVLSGERTTLQYGLLFGRSPGYAHVRLDRYDRGFVPIEVAGGFVQSPVDRSLDDMAPVVWDLFEQNVVDIRASGARLVFVMFA